MLIIISSSKTLDFSKAQLLSHTNPLFINDSNSLAEICQALNVIEIKNILKISEKLAKENAIRWQDYNNAVQQAVIYAYQGDVFKQLDTNLYNKKQLDFAQKHLRIISGLYGALRPLDLIKPYRLEMSTKLPKIGMLSDFWQDKITDYLSGEVSKHQNKIIINLASKEYSAAVNIRKLNCKFINIHFKEYRNGHLQIIGINAKRARGQMLDYIIQENIDDLEKVKKFNRDYQFSQELSSDKDFVFIKNN